jgi:hypothetical protein
LKEGEGFWFSCSVSSLHLTVSHSLVQSPCVSRQERVKGRTGKNENREERRRKERVAAGWKRNIEDEEFLVSCCIQRRGWVLWGALTACCANRERSRKRGERAFSDFFTTLKMERVSTRGRSFQLGVRKTHLQASFYRRPER